MRLVWTIHNITPHEPETTNDLRIARFIAKRANAKIIHSKHVVGAMNEAELDSSRTYVIPHGNYRGIYPSDITRSDARKKLSIGSNETVILFFGMVRAYKGIDELIEAYAKVRNKRTRLLVVGSSQDRALSRRITEAVKQGGIASYLQFINDKDVALYFKACDIVALPFRAITTSGSALLALTFDKPIIAPRSGSLIDIPRQAGYFYDPTDATGLDRALAQAIGETSELQSKIQVATDYAKTLEWDVIAKKTLKLYQNEQGVR